MKYQDLLKTNKELKYEIDDLNGKILELEGFKKSAGIYRGFLHEFRNLNSQLKGHCEAMGCTIEEPKDNKDRRINSVYAISQLFTSRLNFLNYELYQEGTPFNINIHKKFYKAKRVLDPIAYEKKISIYLEDVQFDFYAYDFIDLIPFILIHNAIKFSQDAGTINITFKKNGSNLKVFVQNEGPHIKKNELEKIFERNYRGENGINTGTEGDGLGLFYVKYISTIHKINVTVSSIPKYKVLYQEKHIQYAEINFILTIDSESQ